MKLLLRNNIVITNCFYNQLSVLFVVVHEVGEVNTNFWNVHESPGKFGANYSP